MQTWTLIIHDSPESVEQALWKTDLSEIADFGFELPTGGEVSFSLEEVMESRRQDGAHGFADLPNKTVHFWFSETCPKAKALELIAHELSHALFDTQEPEAIADGLATAESLR